MKRTGRRSSRGDRDLAERQDTARAAKSEQMARVRSADTDIEVALRKELWARGYRYRVRSDVLGHPDITFPRLRIAVFVDGCFWHACPLHGKKPKANRQYWEPKLLRNAARDAAVTRDLTSDGWTVLRVWEHDLRADVSRVADLIEREVRRHRDG